MGKPLTKLDRIDNSIAEHASRFEQVTLMIKNESTIQHYDEPLAFKKARGIQFPVNERSAYEYAAEYAAFSHALVQITSVRGLCEEEHDGIMFSVAYCAKMNHADIGEFATVSERLRRDYLASCIDERDGRNWDSNVQVPHRSAVVRLYEGLDPKLAAHARRGINIRGRFRDRNGAFMSYTVKGTVKSGHPDTSSGNSALNREISMQAILALPKHLRPRLVRGLTLGDDYLAWLYFDHPVDWGELAAALSAAERALGIDPKRGIFSDIRCASFISLGFYLGVSGSVIALPKVGRLLCRLMWTVTPLQGRDPRRLASGVAHAFYPLYNTCDFMRVFFKAHMAVAPLGGDAFCPGYMWAVNGLNRLPEPINWRDNHMVKYGIDAALLELGALQNIDCALCHHPTVRDMYKVDVADPDERRGCVSRS